MELLRTLVRPARAVWWTSLLLIAVTDTYALVLVCLGRSATPPFAATVLLYLTLLISAPLWGALVAVRARQPAWIITLQGYVLTFALSLLFETVADAVLHCFPRYATVPTLHDELLHGGWFTVATLGLLNREGTALVPNLPLGWMLFFAGASSVPPDRSDARDRR